MFHTSTPATDGAFFDRRRELRQLIETLQSLRAGTPRWVALLGVRKLGKTSLLFELTRRFRHRDTRFVVLDSFEVHQPGLEIFRRLALRTIDAFFADGLGLSLEAIADQPESYRGALLDSKAFNKLDRALKTDLLKVPDLPFDLKLAELALGLGERLAVAFGGFCVVAWDEFQVLTRLDASKKVSVLPLARAVWQRHKRSAYIICGSERALLTDLVSSPTSPFFQHFTVMELLPMGEKDAAQLLLESAPPRRKISPAIAKEAARVLNGHPFYLQLFGETLTASPGPYDEGAVKQAYQELLFSRTGRLALFFQNEFDRLVGNAATLAATLEALADGPQRLADIGRTIKASTGSMAQYLSRLGDAVVHRPDGLYALADPVFGLWLQWKKPGGTVVPMTVIGDEAERRVAAVLSEMGFELVYQSRASRGAFDLLAIKAGVPLGIQVKRSPLPLSFSKAAWARLNGEARQLQWRWVVAQVEPGGAVCFLDPRKAKQGRTATLGAGAEVANLLTWLK